MTESANGIVLLDEFLCYFLRINSGIYRRNDPKVLDRQVEEARQPHYV